MSRLKGLLARKIIAAVAGIGLVAGGSLAYGVQAVTSGQPASFTIQRQSLGGKSKPIAASSSTTVNYQTAKVGGEVHATVTGLPNLAGMMGGGGPLGGLMGGDSSAAAKTASPPIASSVMSFGANGSGAVNLSTNEEEGSIHIDGFIGSMLGGPVQVRVTGNTAYLSVPVLSMFDGGKPWVSISIPQSLLTKISQPHSFYYTQPGGWLDLLKPVSSSITDVGTATVNGHNTTIYKATINVTTVVNDIMQYVKSAIPIPSKMQSKVGTAIKALESDLHASVDLYVGGTGLVRRVTGSLTGTFPSLASIMQSGSGSSPPNSSSKLHGTALGSRGSLHGSPTLCPEANATTATHCIKLPRLPLPKLPTAPITINVEGELTFSSFGTPVSVTAPSAGQTVTASSLVSSIMKLFNSFKGIFGNSGKSGSGSSSGSGTGSSNSGGTGISGGLGGIFNNICSNGGSGSSGSGGSGSIGGPLGGILNSICSGSSGSGSSSGSGTGNSGGIGGLFGGGSISGSSASGRVSRA